MSKALDPIAWVKDLQMEDVGYEARRREARAKVRNLLSVARDCGFLLSNRSPEAVDGD